MGRNKFFYNEYLISDQNYKNKQENYSYQIHSMKKSKFQQLHILN